MKVFIWNQLTTATSSQITAIFETESYIGRIKDHCSGWIQNLQRYCDGQSASLGSGGAVEFEGIKRKVQLSRPHSSIFFFFKKLYKTNRTQTRLKAHLSKSLRIRQSTQLWSSGQKFRFHVICSWKSTYSPLGLAEHECWGWIQEVGPGWQKEVTAGRSLRIPCPSPFLPLSRCLCSFHNHSSEKVLAFSDFISLRCCDFFTNQNNPATSKSNS